MDRRLLSLLRLAFYVIVAVQLSTASSDDPRRAKTPPSPRGDGPHSQGNTDIPEATAATLDSHVNGTEDSGDATFVRVADTKDQQANTDKDSAPSSKKGEGERGEKGETDGATKSDKSKENERPIVTYIPELPTSIAKPGRLLNASWFIMFYASWCEHSQRAEPEFLKAIQMLSDSNITGMFIGKIDVTKHGEIAKRFKIKGTPTFAFFKFGVRFDFIEDNSAKNLYDFAAKIVKAKTDRVNTTQQLSDLQKNHSIVFLLVHDEEIDVDWHSVYMKMASEKALVAKFAYTTEPDIVKEHGINRLPCVLVLKDGKAFVYKDALSGYTLARWVGIEKFLTFPSVNETNIRHHLHPVSGRKLAVLVVHEKESERRIAQKKAFELVKRVALSRQMHSKYQFILLEGAELAEKLLGWSVPLPSLFVYEPYSGLYYMYRQSEGKGLTEESLKGFLHNVSNGIINPEGGSSLLDRIVFAGRLGYAVIMTMVTHRPMLSLATVLSLLAVTSFYLIIFCQREKQPKIIPKDSRTLAKKAALRKKKKEEAQKMAASQSSNSKLRKRGGKSRDDTGIDSEEVSHSEGRSGTGTQSEGESGSQVESSSERETKKKK